MKSSVKYLKLKSCRVLLGFQLKVLYTTFTLLLYCTPDVKDTEASTVFALAMCVVH